MAQRKPPARHELPPDKVDPALNPRFASIPVEAEQPTASERVGQVAWEIFKTLGIIIVAALIIRALVVQPFFVEGTSMEPNFHPNDYLLVNQLSYHFGSPQRGDVIVFRAPPNPSENYIKRILGIPGDTVSLRDGHFTVANPRHPQGAAVTENYIREGITTQPESDQTTWHLGPGEYFVVGDNREPAKSSDSRAWGLVPRKNIIGKVSLRVYPLSDFGLIKSAKHPELSFREVRLS